MNSQKSTTLFLVGNMSLILEIIQYNFYYCPIFSVSTIDGNSHCSEGLCIGFAKLSF